MIFCKKCGNEINEYDKFCKNCGAAISIADVERRRKTIQMDGQERSAADLVKYCMEHRFINVANYMQDQTKKEWRIFFENIIDAIQSDETPILCFAGHHDYDGGLRTSGMHGYMLTDKRLIIAGWIGEKLNPLSLIKATSVLVKATLDKNPKCSMESIYVPDIIGTTTDMVSGWDVITFHTAKGNFNVMFYNHDVTHQFSNRINEILKQLKAV